MIGSNAHLEVLQLIDVTSLQPAPQACAALPVEFAQRWHIHAILLSRTMEKWPR
jgi:hypothetical protein